MNVAVVGSLSLDSVDGGAPRIGGCPFYAARALRALGTPRGDRRQVRRAPTGSCSSRR